MNFITAEVAKFCANKRINEKNINDLNKRIQMEAYLREKKEAILQDRINEADNAAALSNDILI